MRGSDGVKYHLRPMRSEDLEQVSAIEKEAFSTLWPPTSFKRELVNRMARYLVAVQDSPHNVSLPEHLAAVRRPRTFFGLLRQLARTILFPGELIEELPTDILVGFVGTWFMVDEAHITGIAVSSAYRGHGLGELLLMGAIDMAIRRRARVVTLETRVSNNVARSLYEKYGFHVSGMRKRYYADNNEDALIMTTPTITSVVYGGQFREMMDNFKKRHGNPVWTLA
jgi:ribosomal-protein-alanine N-acetyltransferase